MPMKHKCEHCGAVRNAYEFHGEKIVRVKLVLIQDRGTTLTLCEACEKARVVEKHGGGEAEQLRLFE